jgi:ABC-type microcin C transport system permease subunit YejE
MNPTTQPANSYGVPGSTPRPSAVRSRPLLEEIFGPVDPAADVLERRLLVARSVVAYLGLVLTLVQVVVWLMIGLVTTHLDSPWWLWTTAPAAAAVAGLTAVQHWHRWWTQAHAEPEAGR